MAMITIRRWNESDDVSALTALLSRLTSMAVCEAKNNMRLQEITDLPNKR